MNKIIKQIEKFHISLIVKYGFSVLLMIDAHSRVKNNIFLFFGVIALISVAVLSNAIIQKNKIAGIIVNDIFIVIFNAQFMILLFSRQFLAVVMLENIASVGALQGKGMTYILGGVLAVLFGIIPINYVNLKHNEGWIVSALLCTNLLVGGVVYNYPSPYVQLVNLGIQESDRVKQKKAIMSIGDTRKEFYKSGITDGIKSPSAVSNKPNVVLIFTEGLSQNVIDDDRDIMPKVRYWQEQSLNFTNYYNHAFATYRGVPGQLYSGYVMYNTDTNNLISMQDIFHDNGYETTFINPESGDSTWSYYLSTLGFDNLIDGSKDNTIYSISDRSTYNLLFDTMEKQHEDGKKFFDAIYIFNTHVGQDDQDVLYGNGENHLLNRFYNSDFHFGDFMEKFNASDMSDDTIIVFTADHCTYGDEDFTNTFPDYDRPNIQLDKIPFFIYYKGVQHQDIDANGRNTLDMAPTVLDYLDISQENYFLGTSLLAEKASELETVYFDGTYYWRTDNGNMTDYNTNNDDIKNLIMKYISASYQS